MRHDTSAKFALNDFKTDLAISLSLHVMAKKIGESDIAISLPEISHIIDMNHQMPKNRTEHD
jgi:hypothetical protein